MRILIDLLDRLRSTFSSAAAEGKGFACENARTDAPQMAPLHPNAVLEAMDLLAIMAVVRDDHGIVLSANRTFHRYFAGEEVQHKTLEQLGLPLSIQPVLEPQDLELSLNREAKVFSWKDIAFTAPGTGQTLWLGCACDVTAERRMAHEREEARLQAQEVSLSKSRQLATVVHELRTPLNGILGMSHLLQQTPLTPEQRNYLNGISQAGSAMAQLVDDLLDYSTIEAGRFRLNSRAENIRQLLESVVEMLAPRAHEKNIEIGATVASDVPPLMDFDPARLRQVLFNVIGNAVKFTKKGGVLICVNLDGPQLVITVSDTGPGMSAEDRDRIFEEFEQVGNASERSGGTGLGLSISSRILKEFGGFLSVESSMGVGTTFTISLPAISADASKEGSDRMLLLRSSRVLLLAPDGPAARATIATIETLGGRCRHVQSAAEADVVISSTARQNLAFTDMIVDHRIAGVEALGPVATRIRRILLVSPEERGHQRWDAYDAWLIRPLREQSLIDVLRGRLGGSGSGVMSSNSNEDYGFDLQRYAGLKVLLAEDDPVSAMVVSAVLRKAGCTVRHVKDLSALEDAVFSSEIADIVISDLHMPGGDLSSVLARMRSAPLGNKLTELPVLVMSGETNETLKTKVLSAGARCVLQKPVDPHRLLAEISALTTPPAERV